MLGKTENKRRKGRQRLRWLDGITDLIDMNLSKLGDSGDRGAWRAAVHEVSEIWTGLSNRTTTINLLKQTLEHAFEIQK